jgi:hypothetical protein
MGTASFKTAGEIHSEPWSEDDCTENGEKGKTEPQNPSVVASTSSSSKARGIHVIPMPWDDEPSRRPIRWTQKKTQTAPHKQVTVMNQRSTGVACSGTQSDAGKGPDCNGTAYATLKAAASDDIRRRDRRRRVNAREPPDDESTAPDVAVLVEQGDTAGEPSCIRSSCGHNINGRQRERQCIHRCNVPHHPVRNAAAS